jgi:hypothetical protein
MGHHLKTASLSINTNVPSISLHHNHHTNNNNQQQQQHQQHQQQQQQQHNQSMMIGSPKTARSIEDIASCFNAWNIHSPLPSITIHSAPVTPATPIAFVDFEKAKQDFQQHFLHTIRNRQLSKERSRMRPVSSTISPIHSIHCSDDDDDDSSIFEGENNNNNIRMNSSMQPLSLFSSNIGSVSSSTTTPDYSIGMYISTTTTHNNNIQQHHHQQQHSEGNTVVHNILSACVHKRNIHQSKKIQKPQRAKVSLIERRKKKLIVTAESFGSLQSKINNTSS